MNNALQNSNVLQSNVLAIYNAFPDIFSYEDVLVCSTVYYPISVVEVLVEELVSQAFSPLEHMILELIKSGFRSLDDIVQAVGLPSMYVETIIEELEKLDIINAYKLTENGEYSYAKKIKSTTRIYKQTYQYDPLLQEAFLEQQIEERFLVPINVTRSEVIHFLPHSYFSQDQLNNMFLNAKESEPKENKKVIKEVLAVKTYFVEVIALLFNLIPHPFVFFPDGNGECINLLTVSEANLNYYRDKQQDKLTVTRKKYHDLWINLKQIKDEMKKKQDNLIVKRDIKSKVSNLIQFCKEDHTIITDSGLKLIFEFDEPFTFDYKHFEALLSLEWRSRHIPFLVLSDDDDYSNIIAYSECYNKTAYNVSKLLFSLSQSIGSIDELYKILDVYFKRTGATQVSIEMLIDAISHINLDQKSEETV